MSGSNRIEALEQVGTQLAGVLTAAELSATVLTLAKDLLHATSAALYLADTDADPRICDGRGVALWTDADRPSRRAGTQHPLAAVATSGSPLFLDTPAAVAARFPHLAPGALGALAILPLVQAAGASGSVTIGFAEARAFDPEERHWLGRLAGQVALAAGRVTRYESERRAREEAELLVRISESINQPTLDLDTIVQRLTDEATRAVGAEFGAFFYNVLDAQGESYLLYTLSGAPKEAFAKFGLPRNTPIFAPTFAGEGPVRLDDVKKDPRYGQMGPHHGMPKGHLPVTSYLAVPVIAPSGEVLGGLFFGHSQPARFTVPHERIVKGIAAQAALSIHNAKMLRASREAEEAQRRLVAHLSETVRLNELFTGVLAHDLRTPLGAIVTGAELLRMRGLTTPDPRNGKALERILNSGRRMSRMIEQLLDFTRLRVGAGMTLEGKSADLTALTRTAVGELEQTHPDRRVSVEEIGDLRGVWDADRLSQVLSNLIGNALQHGEPAEGVRVTLDGGEAETVRVRVQNGGAIPPEQIARLFDPLSGGERRKDRSRGLGLGLFITREIARAHGGQVSATSEVANGTTFTVTLPRVFERTGAEAEGELRVGEAAGRTPRPREPTRDQLRESEARFRLLVDAVKDYAIFMLDPTGRVLTWNVGAKRIKGYDAGEIIGQHFSRFYEEDEIKSGKCEHELEAAARDGRFEDEGWRLRKDGTRFWANVVITALRNAGGELVGFTKVTRDLTDRRRLEQEQLRLARAEEAIRLRDEFLSLASHELKTPLTVLQMQLDTLHERLDASDHKATTKLLRAAQSSERLAALIESLLDVSRIATGRFALNPRNADLVEIAAHLVDTLRPHAAKVGCELVLAGDASLLGSWDQIRIEQVLANLLSNAIKYGAGRPVEVSIEARAGAAVIAVRDHGAGLPEAEVGRLFQRFERASSSRHYGGLGVGLYLVQEIVAAHGGTVSAANAEGGGARFEVRLPMPAALAAGESASEQPDLN
ncbi:MAG TPA: ATP-binding protein [Polyangia bacterium]|nr:ATP-binding protein [Polyangia bacterium]